MAYPAQASRHDIGRDMTIDAADTAVFSKNWPMPGKIGGTRRSRKESAKHPGQPLQPPHGNNMQHDD